MVCPGLKLRLQERIRLASKPAVAWCYLRGPAKLAGGIEKAHHPTPGLEEDAKSAGVVGAETLFALECCRHVLRGRIGFI